MNPPYGFPAKTGSPLEAGFGDIGPDSKKSPFPPRYGPSPHAYNYGHSSLATLSRVSAGKGQMMPALALPLSQPPMGAAHGSPLQTPPLHNAIHSPPMHQNPQSFANGQLHGGSQLYGQVHGAVGSHYAMQSPGYGGVVRQSHRLHQIQGLASLQHPRGPDGGHGDHDAELYAGVGAKAPPSSERLQQLQDSYLHSQPFALALQPIPHPAAAPQHGSQHSHLQHPPHPHPPQHQPLHLGSQQQLAKHALQFSPQLQMAQSPHLGSQGRVQHTPVSAESRPPSRSSTAASSSSTPLGSAVLHPNPALSPASIPASRALSPASSSGSHAAVAIVSKSVPHMFEDGTRKRGRPKKLILDPATNQYIDSSHANFKKLNKLLKQSTPARTTPSPVERGTKIAALNEEEMKQLLDSRDRRGRPRKFPIEQTGLTIRGVRVSGSAKGVRKDGERRKRGRPKRVV